MAATQEEVDRTNTVLLARQIARLEKHAVQRAARDETKVVLHYKFVAERLRAGEDGFDMPTKLTHARVRSEPVFVQSELMLSLERRRSDSELHPVAEEVPQSSRVQGSAVLELQMGVRSVPVYPQARWLSREQTR